MNHMARPPRENRERLADMTDQDAAVLVPTFNDPRDRQALETLAELLPGRRVVGIHAVDLVLGLGTVHCMTQQEPAGSPQGGNPPRG